VISPSIYDYMSYCWVELDDQIGKTWTSPFTYHRLLEWMQARTSSSNVKGQLLAEQNYLLVSGLIFTDDTVQMDPAWIVSSTTPLQVPPSGTDYCLDAVDISDNVLYTTCFDLSFISNGTGNPMSVTGISASIPWADNAAKYVLRKGGNVLAARAVSSHSPSVSITSPSAGDAWLVDSIHTISWTSNDLDGDALTYTILYSPDGTQWLPLAAQYKQTSFQVKTSDLPGGANAQIRVLASDGLLTTRVDSSVFSVAKNVPKVWINTPSSNQTFTVGPPIVFQGAAYDMEDGSLYGSQLEWRVDGSPLGIGEQILTQLPPGVHQITLIATDQDGNHSSANINLTIDGSQIFLAYIRR
jgi:hypothetical protein